MMIVKNIPRLSGEDAGNPEGRAKLGGRISAVEKGTISNGTFDETAQHEKGHNLGLEHSEVKDLMYKSVNGSIEVGNKKRGDIVNKQVRYQGDGTYKDSNKYSASKRKASAIKQEAQKFLKNNKITY